MIVAVSNPAISALKRATQTTPIVMAVAGDPVGGGFVASLARPGGNITGLSNVSEAIAAKLLELLKEAVPSIARVGVLWTTGPVGVVHRREIESAARVLGVTSQFFEVRGADDITRAFAALTGKHGRAFIALPLTVIHRQQIVDLAAKHRLPGIYGSALFVEVGGLMAYAPSRSDMCRRAATYVVKILKGAQPASLPIEQPTKFELSINLKTAKALGVTVPPSLRLRADQVIE